MRLTFASAVAASTMSAAGQSETIAASVDSVDSLLEPQAPSNKPATVNPRAICTFFVTFMCFDMRTVKPTEVNCRLNQEYRSAKFEPIINFTNLGMNFEIE